MRQFHDPPGGGDPAWQADPEPLRPFQVEEEGFDWQHEMPQVSARKTGRTGPNCARLLPRSCPRTPGDFLRERPIEIREVEPRDFLTPEKVSDRNYLWFRMGAAEGQNPVMQHACLLCLGHEPARLLPAAPWADVVSGQGDDGEP